MPAERDLFNRVTEVNEDPLLSVEDTLALGLLTWKKWDRTIHQCNDYGRSLTPQLLMKVSESFTQSDIGSFRQTARRMLNAYSHTPEPWLRGSDIMAAFAWLMAPE